MRYKITTKSRVNASILSEKLHQVMAQATAWRKRPPRFARWLITWWTIKGCDKFFLPLDTVLPVLRNTQERWVVDFEGRLDDNEISHLKAKGNRVLLLPNETLRRKEAKALLKALKKSLCRNVAKNTSPTTATPKSQAPKPCGSRSVGITARATTGTAPTPPRNAPPCYAIRSKTG